MPRRLGRLKKKMTEKTKGLLSEYHKGYIHSLCDVIKIGCKRISDDLDDILYEVDASENEFRQAIEKIA